MRIAAKRLRYILEATDFCFGKPAQTAARRARDLQGLLGELHDCDVMLPVIESQIADLRAEDAAAVRERAAMRATSTRASPPAQRHRTAYRGLEVLAVYVQARRELLFDRFRVFWSEQERAGTWDRLERAVTRRLERGAGAAAERGADREGAPRARGGRAQGARRRGARPARGRGTGGGARHRGWGGDPGGRRADPRSRRSKRARRAGCRSVNLTLHGKRRAASFAVEPR